MSIGFENFFSIENFRSIIDCERKKDMFSPQQHIVMYNKLLEINFHNPMQQYINYLREQNKLVEIKNSQTHTTRTAYLWNLLIKGEKDKYGQNLNSLFDRVLDFHLYTLVDKENIDKSNLVEAYQKIVEKINGGSFINYEMSEYNSECAECGQRLRLSFKNWAPQYDVLKIMPDGQINYKEIEAPKECLENAVVQLDINFPSGELIITDWLRIKEFSDLVKGDDEWAPERSLNHTKGRITNTKRYAQLFNFICVSLGNMSPHIFSRGDDLIFGHLQEDKSLDKNLTEKGYVCTDFWGVSIIDKEQLISLLTQKYPENAQKIVDDYINENKGNITLLKVDAGSYQLNFHGNYENFNSFNKDASLSSIEQCFTLNKIETPKMKMKR